MKPQWYVAIGLVVALVIALYVKWDKRHNTYTLPSKVDGTIKITPTEVKLITRTGNNKIDTKTVPNYGHGVEVVKHGDTVTYSPVITGWSVTPGFSTDFNRVGLSMELGFYKRFSFIVGSNFFNLRTQSWDVRIHGGIGYRLPWGYVDNISIYSGIDSSKQATIGVFLRFGGN